ncbi:MAG: hypothetical protein R6U04_03390 [Bacteroidales bacterium]
MEKLSKTIINPEKVMKNEDLVNFRGGVELGYFYCRCGHVGSYTGECFPVMADDVVEALSVADSFCGEPGNTCNGDGCPD